MTMTITWVADRNDLDLKPTWEVREVRIHTVERYLCADGVRRDQLVMAVFFTETQWHNLVKDYGLHTLPKSVLGTVIIPLNPGAVLWRWAPPPTHPGCWEPYEYTGFTLIQCREPEGRR